MTRTPLLFTILLILLGLKILTAQSRHIYVSDGGNFNLPPWQILKFDENGENGEVFIDDHLAWPQDILFLENKNEVLISNLNSGRISRFDATTGEFINEFATNIGGPTRMKIGADGLLYVLQWSGNGRVWRYHVDGTFIDEFTDTGVNASIGMDWDSKGNLYVSSYNGGFVRKFNSSGDDLGNFISTDLAGPTNIWFSENRDLFVVDYNGGSVKRFDSTGTFKGIFISSLPQGEGVDFWPNGDIVIGSGGTSSVRIYNSEGMFIRNLVPPGTLDLLVPNAVVIREDSLSSGVSNLRIYKDIVFATPSVGTYFQIATDDLELADTRMDIYDSSGVHIHQLNLTDSSHFDASRFVDGIYFLTLQVVEGAIARQKIVVQR